MKLSSYASSLNQIKELSQNGFLEVILAPSLLSRFGRTELNEFINLSKFAKELKLNTICEWDILLTENSFSSLLNNISENDFKYIDEFRVQDTGVLNYLLKNYKQKIQFIAETGNHNLRSLLAFQTIIGSRLSRIILSLELPQNKLKEFSEKLSTPTEILIFGRINLFYSPRKLISPYLDKTEDNKYIEIEVNSEESPHKGFPLIQNSHGTFMMNPKDHCLLENVKDLEQAGVSFCRIDLRFDDLFKHLNLIVGLANEQEQFRLEQLKSINKRGLIRGFFAINKTDHQFKKLKNHRIQRRDDLYVGEVLDVKKGAYIGFRVKDNAEFILDGKWLELKTPEGKIKKLQIKRLCNSGQDNIKQVSLNQIIYTNHVSGISIRTAVYISQDPQ
jgi:U32 family peptidase